MQVNPVDRTPNWRPTGADVGSTGVPRQITERHAPAAPAGNNAGVVVSPAVAAGVESTKKGAPDEPTPVVEISNYDWTIKKPVVENPEVPPRKPLYLQLIEHLQAMWRASGNAVEVVDEVNKAVNPAKLVQGPLVYPDPKLKKVSRN